MGKPPEKKLNLTPENIKSQVTDPNILHHIAVGERQQQLKRERKESEECQQDTEDGEQNEVMKKKTQISKMNQMNQKNKIIVKLEEYGDWLCFARI